MSVRRDTATNSVLLTSLTFIQLIPSAGDESDPKELIGSEVVRLAFAPESARALVNLMCESLDYYPLKVTDGTP